MIIFIWLQMTTLEDSGSKAFISRDYAQAWVIPVNKWV